MTLDALTDLPGDDFDDAEDEALGGCSELHGVILDPAAGEHGTLIRLGLAGAVCDVDAVLTPGQLIHVGLLAVWIGLRALGRGKWPRLMHHPRATPLGHSLAPRNLAR